MRSLLSWLRRLPILPVLLTAQATAATLIPPPAAPLQAQVGGLVTLPLQAPAPTLCSSPQPPLRLQLSGFPTGLTPVGCDSTSATPSVTFHLSPETAGSDQAADRGWQMILRNPWRDHPQDFVRLFSATLHSADGTQLQPAQPLQLQLVTPARLGFGLLLIIATWAVLAHFGRHSSMLRDSNSTATDLDRPYSLSRVQMAWWFGLVFTAYVFIWLMTWDWVPITATTLSLLGISGATGLVAHGIDQSPPTPGQPRRTVSGTAGFFRDILTDVNGITLARLQLVIWNASLGGLFLAQVLGNLRIPELDPSTLALLGLSASAYVGFKVPEQQNPSSPNGSTTTSQPPFPAASPVADTAAGPHPLPSPTAMSIPAAFSASFSTEEGNYTARPPSPAEDPKRAYGV